MQLKSKRRMTFTHGAPDTTPGEELDDLAQAIRKEQPTLSYRRALEIAVERRPDLGTDHVGGPVDEL